MNGKKEMPEKKMIDARSFVGDLRSSMNDLDLMNKYKLTAKGLQSALRKLVAAGVVRSTELDSRSFDCVDSVGVQGLRSLDRNLLDFPLPICEENNPEIRGTVHDITERGVGTVGIETEANDIRVFAIPADEFFLVEAVVFKAKCRWVKRDEESGSAMAGFEIMNVSKGSLTALRKLIQALTFAEAHTVVASK
jgi:hypothetical protein